MALVPEIFNSENYTKCISKLHNRYLKYSGTVRMKIFVKSDVTLAFHTCSYLFKITQRKPCSVVVRALEEREHLT